MFKLTYLVALLAATAVIAVPREPGPGGCQIPLSESVKPLFPTVATPGFRGYSSADCNEASFVGQFLLTDSSCRNLTVAGLKLLASDYSCKFWLLLTTILIHLSIFSLILKFSSRLFY